MLQVSRRPGPATWSGPRPRSGDGETCSTDIAADLGQQRDADDPRLKKALSDLAAEFDALSLTGSTDGLTRLQGLDTITGPVGDQMSRPGPARVGRRRP